MMALNVAPQLCPVTVALNIFMLNLDITKTHYNNVGFNFPDNAPLADLLSSPGQTFTNHGPQD
jgi:hypothetical protein